MKIFIFIVYLAFLNSGCATSGNKENETKPFTPKDGYPAMKYSSLK